MAESTRQSNEKGDTSSEGDLASKGGPPEPESKVADTHHEKKKENKTEVSDTTDHTKRLKGSEIETEERIPAATSTAASSTITAEVPAAASEPEITVYCDACGKARILKTSFAETFDLTKRWTCVETCIQGCDQPDDEITNIAGDMFAKVLDAAGIKTRKQLANSFSEEFDSGPWEAYIIDWISKAQGEEIHDAMQEIFQEEDLIEELATAGVETPADVIRYDASNLMTLVSEVLHRPQDDLEDLVNTWKATALSIAENLPWMLNM